MEKTTEKPVIGMMEQKDGWWEHIKTTAVLSLPVIGAGLTAFFGYATKQKIWPLNGSTNLSGFLGGIAYHRLKRGVDWKESLCKETGHTIEEYDKALTKKIWQPVLEKVVDRYDDSLGQHANNAIKGFTSAMLIPIYGVYQEKEKKRNQAQVEKWLTSFAIGHQTPEVRSIKSVESHNVQPQTVIENASIMRDSAISNAALRTI